MYLVHEGGKGNDFKCALCDQLFMEPGLMRKHVRTVHKEEKEYKCDPCDKIFPTLVDFRTHKNSVHKGYKYKCNPCGRLYSTTNILQFHISENVHEGNKNGQDYECAICNQLFSEQSSLRKHVKKLHETHTEPTCNPCGKSFATPGALKHHLATSKNHEGNFF